MCPSAWHPRCGVHGMAATLVLVSVSQCAKTRLSSWLGPWSVCSSSSKAPGLMTSGHEHEAYDVGLLELRMSELVLLRWRQLLGPSFCCVLILSVLGALLIRPCCVPGPPPDKLWARVLSCAWSASRRWASAPVSRSGKTCWLG